MGRKKKVVMKDITKTQEVNVSCKKNYIVRKTSNLKSEEVENMINKMYKNGYEFIDSIFDGIDTCIVFKLDKSFIKIIAKDTQGEIKVHPLSSWCQSVKLEDYILGKLNKQSSGVGNYLKYHKEKSTGGDLPDNHQQAKENIKPSCFTCVWHLSGAEACGECVEFSWWQRV